MLCVCYNAVSLSLCVHVEGREGEEDGVLVVLSHFLPLFFPLGVHTTPASSSLSCSFSALMPHTFNYTLSVPLLRDFLKHSPGLRWTGIIYLCSFVFHRIQSHYSKSLATSLKQRKNVSLVFFFVTRE